MGRWRPRAVLSLTAYLLSYADEAGLRLPGLGLGDPPRRVRRRVQVHRDGTATPMGDDHDPSSCPHCQPPAAV